MSNLFRQLCATLIVLLFIRCSQSQLTIGSALHDGLESVTEEDNGFDDEVGKRASWMKIGKRDVSNRYKISRQHTRLGKRSEEETEEAELSDNPYTRLARAQFLRFGRGPFLRFRRSPSDSTFLRIGRASSGQTFLRIGKDQEAVKRFLRFGRSGSGSTWLRIGKRTNGFMNDEASQGELTDEEMQLILANKDLLLKLLEKNPQLTDDDGYFAFPRQGRAMSFYFPRLGRSGDDDTKPAYCCTGGVRGVMSAGKGEFEICPREQSCCPGFTERTKRYKDIYIVECAAMDSDMENIRAYIGEE